MELTMEAAAPEPAAEAAAKITFVNKSREINKSLPYKIKIKTLLFTLFF